MTNALPGVLLMLLCLLQSAYGLANLGPEVTDPANFLPPRILVRAETTTVVGSRRAQVLDRQATASALPEWLSREPLGESESLNLYSYCHNDPVNNVDVLGLAPAGLTPEQSRIFDDYFKEWAKGGHITGNTAAEILAVMRMDGQLDDPSLVQAERLRTQAQIGDVYRKNPILINTVAGVTDAVFHMIPGHGPEGEGAADGSNTPFMLAVDSFRLFGGALIAMDPGSRRFREKVYPDFVEGYNAKYSYGQRTGAEIVTLLAPFAPKVATRSFGALSEGVASINPAYFSLSETALARPGLPGMVRSPLPFTAKSGAGQFGRVIESMSDRAALYQSRITGRLPDAGYTANGVKFDGFDTARGVLLDAKGPGYATFVRDGQFMPWYNGADSMVAQAQRQLGAAGGSPIEWHFAEEAAANAMRNLLQSRGIEGISIFHTP